MRRPLAQGLRGPIPSFAAIDVIASKSLGYSDLDSATRRIARSRKLVRVLRWTCHQFINQPMKSRTSWGCAIVARNSLMFTRWLEFESRSFDHELLEQHVAGLSLSVAATPT